MEWRSRIQRPQNRLNNFFNVANFGFIPQVTCSLRSDHRYNFFTAVNGHTKLNVASLPKLCEVRAIGLLIFDEMEFRKSVFYYQGPFGAVRTVYGGRG